MIIKNLRQEYYDSGNQILSYYELNEFSGTWMHLYETRIYDQNSQHHEAWEICFKNFSDDKSLKQARMLSKQAYRGSSYELAHKSKEGDW